MSNDNSGEVKSFIDRTIDDIEHYGVLGMKWGVRKSRGGKTSQAKKKTTNKGKPKQEEKPENEAKELPKSKQGRKSVTVSRRKLTDADIDNMIKRLEKEKRLKDLLDSDVNRGKKFITEVSSTAAKSAAKRVATGSLMYLIKISIDKGMKNPELASFVAPGGKKK